MRNLWISLNEKYQRNKSIIWFIIAVVVFFLLVTRNLDKINDSSGGSGNESATSESVYSNSMIENSIKSVTNTCDDDYETMINELENTYITDGNIIKLFIEMCNNKKFESAYAMLSDDCKNLLYPTKEKFMELYANSVFNNYKNYKIDKFNERTYKVDYKEDAITTGGSTASVSSEYITITNDGKINISNLIGKQDMNIKANNEYLSFEITGKISYINYEVYQIKIKNIVKADIYINENMNNGVYIMDSAKKRIGIVLEDYIDQDYLIPSETTKVLNLKFNRSYSNNSTDLAMHFENIKIVNKNYYNYETNKLQMTKYPEKASFVIDFND